MFKIQDQKKTYTGKQKLIHTTFITQVVSMLSRILSKSVLFTLIGFIFISLQHSSCPVLNRRTSFLFQKVPLSFWNRFCLNEMAHTIIDRERGREREYGIGRKREREREREKVLLAFSPSFVIQFFCSSLVSFKCLTLAKKWGKYNLCFKKKKKNCGPLKFKEPKAFWRRFEILFTWSQYQPFLFLTSEHKQTGSGWTWLTNITSLQRGFLYRIRKSGSYYFQEKFNF